MSEWYYRSDHEIIGPISSAALQQKAETGAIKPDTQIRKGIGGQWVFAMRVKGLFSGDAVRLANASPPPPRKHDQGTSFNKPPIVVRDRSAEKQFGDQPTPIPGLDPREYEHPFDRKALDALQHVKGFDYILRKYSEHFDERINRLIFTGSNIKVTKDAFPSLYEALIQACQTLDLAFVPELYIAWDYSVNAAAWGIERPFVVLNSGSVDLLTAQEMLYLLGHELGHIKSGHVLYHQLAAVFPILGEILGAATLGLGKLAAGGIDVALYYWSRMSEFTADRAGMLACQDDRAALSALTKMAGLPKGYYDKVDVNAFIAQAKEFDSFDTSQLNWIAKIMLATHRTHPWTVMRASELLRWIESSDYAAILERKTGAQTRRGPSTSRLRHLGESRAMADAISALDAKDRCTLDALRAIVPPEHKSHLLVMPNIPQALLADAGQTYARSARLDHVLFLYHGALPQGTKDGLCLTRDTLYCYFGNGAIEIPLEDIHSIRVEKPNSPRAADEIYVNDTGLSVARDGCADVLVDIIALVAGFDETEVIAAE